MRRTELKSNMSMLETFAKRIGYTFIVIAMVSVTSFITGLLLMLLWNWIMPNLGVSTLTYMQSWGLMLMSHLLFSRTVNVSDSN